jgi:hypothetical protein
MCEQLIARLLDIMQLIDVLLYHQVRDKRLAWIVRGYEPNLVTV